LVLANLALFAFKAAMADHTVPHTRTKPTMAWAKPTMSMQVVAVVTVLATTAVKLGGL
jgi:hypothetical protein